LRGKREWLFTAGALTNLEVGHTLLVDFGGQQQFTGVKPQQGSITKLYNGQPDVEELKGRLLSLALRHMSDNEYRLTTSLRPQLFERALGLRRDRKPAA
jgi:hypothetical protein